jgi:hypothetical protein
LPRSVDTSPVEFGASGGGVSATSPWMMRSRISPLLTSPSHDGIVEYGAGCWRYTVRGGL